MNQEIPEETIANLEKQLRYISGMIKQNGRKILNHYPITSPQFIALQFLIDGDLTIGELSNKNGLAFSTTTDLVDRLEKNELVERIKDTSDRRVVRIHILTKGRTIIEEVIQKRQHYLGEVLENSSIDQTEALNEMLTHLYEEMHQVNDN
ncbi:MarR family winged helix-turn-helix transcriptional regulator [Lentibacillus amyloliquefaciens]|uniref:MarR family transcriptional regulator n=1 Tax=Lentibacillus amyloliquefaciens TaxID=1472767 RepID=A0A0U4G6C5_9BACI|nr:MarR family transcriptional regulator [Lentibacillus amyloliquefaciens]ALX48234.1 MarR family transcriptional regulator [Lentibacillus amyloliquefaciens]